MDAAGNAGAWSGVEDFSVDSPSTAVVSPWLFTTDTPTLTWTPIYWADDYNIEVSTNSTFSNVIFSATTDGLVNSVTTTSLGEGVYYWRVRAVSPAEAGGVAAAWSATERFTVDLP